MKLNSINIALTSLVIWSIFLTWNLFSQSKKIAYVETNKLLKEYKGAQKGQAELIAEQDKLKKNLDSLINGWQMELAEFEKDRSNYSAKEIKLKEDLLASKQSQINNYQQVIQNKLQEKDKEITQIVFGEINQFLKDYGDRKGYKFILGANGSGTVVYANDKLNITDQVISELNKQGP